MKDKLSKVALHLLLASAVSLTLLLPGFFFQLFSGMRFTWFTPKYFGIFFGFGLVLSACRSFKVAAATLAGLALLELTQFSCMAYFDEFLTPYAIGFMFLELGEVAQATAASLTHLYYVLPVVLAPYALCLLLLKATWQRQVKIRWFTALVVLFLLFPGVRLQTHSDRKDILKFFPTLSRPSLVNTLNAYYVWLTVLVPRSLLADEGGAFAPYAIEKTRVPEARATIVVLMGESFTWHRMSLFGYERPTTPRLDAMRQDPAFIYKKGISAANATRSALPMFYNVQYNPLDTGLIMRQQANLFHLAKQQGFKTVYISAQKANCLNGVSTSSIDHITTYETAAETFDTHRDEGLLRLLKTVDLGPRNFIVLHQRNMHAPYQDNFEHRPEFAQYPFVDVPYRKALGNAYDNAVLYNDFLIAELIDHLRTAVGGPVYLIVTSDHGEEFGEEGRYGHDNLAIGAADVPVLLYAVNGDPAFVARLRDLVLPTHYELGLLIAERLGYRITNPNQEADIFYVNGVASYGRSGYVRFRRTPSGEAVDVQVLH